MRRELITILGVNFIASLGFSIVIPLLLVIVQQFGGNAFMYGVIAAIYPFFQAIGSTILGHLSDVFGRKRILFISQIINALSWMVFFTAFFLPAPELFRIQIPVLSSTATVTLPLFILVFSRACEGFSAGSVSIVQAYISDISTETDINAHFGYLSVSSILGFIVGPALAGLLGSLGWGEQVPVALTICIAILGAVFVYFFLQDSSHTTDDTLRDGDNLSVLLQKEHVLRSLTIYLFLYTSFNMFLIAFPIYSLEEFGWDTRILGIFFSSVVFLLAIFQLVLLPMLSKQLTEKQLIMTGSVLMGSSYIVLLSDGSYSLAGAVLLFVSGVGMIWPSTLSLLSKYAGKHNQGAAQGMAGMAASIAGVAGLFAGGSFYDNLQTDIFVISALFVYAILGIALLYPRNK
jgi:MFS family permease